MVDGERDEGGLGEQGDAPDRLAILYPDDAPSEEGDRAAQGDGAAAAPAAPSADYELTAPEGFDLSPAMVCEATPIFQELGLDNEGANRLMPLAGKLADHIVTGFETEHSALKKDWAKQTLADPQIGGAKWAETRRFTDRAMAFVGAGKDSELARLLDHTGLGNHPAFIRAFRAFGELVAKPRGASPRKPDRASILYPDD